MKVEVNISKTYLFIIVGAILILAGSIYVYANVDESLPWHDASMIKMSNGDSIEEGINKLYYGYEPGDYQIYLDTNEYLTDNLKEDGYEKLKTITVGSKGGRVKIQYRIKDDKDANSYGQVRVDGTTVAQCEEKGDSWDTCGPYDITINPYSKITVWGRCGKTEIPGRDVHIKDIRIRIKDPSEEPSADLYDI